MSGMDATNLTRETLSKIFAEGKRFDGRGLLDLKELEVEYDVSNKAEGSARVKLGKTEVIAGVKLSTGAPYPDSLDSGNLIVSGDLLPLASPRFEHGPPGFEAIELPRLIDRAIRESGMIDFKKLCITEGENVWNVFLDIYPLNDDGSLIDAASIACVAALRNAVLPGLTDKGIADYKNRTKEKLPLSDVMPISFTFYRLGDSLLLHPTREEEEACDTKISIGISKWNGQYMLNSCQKGHIPPFSSEDLNKMADILPQKYDEVMERFKKFLN